MKNTVNKPSSQLAPVFVMNDWARNVQFNGKCQNDIQALFYFLVLMANAKYECWPGNRRLMSVFGITEPTIIKRLKWLADHGLIARTSMSSPGGRKRTIIRIRVGDETSLPACTGSGKYPKLKKDPTLKNQAPQTKKIGAPTLKPVLSKEDSKEDSKKIFRMNEEPPAKAGGGYAFGKNHSKDHQGEDKNKEGGEVSKIPPEGVVKIIGEFAPNISSTKSVMAFWFALLRHFHPNAPETVLNRKKLPEQQFFALMALLQGQNLSAMFAVAYLVEHWKNLVSGTKWPSPAYLESNVEFVESWEQEYPKFSDTLFRLEQDLGVESRHIDKYQILVLVRAIAVCENPLAELSLSGSGANYGLLESCNSLTYTAWREIGDIMHESGLIQWWQAASDLYEYSGRGGIPIRKMSRQERHRLIKRSLSGESLKNLWPSIDNWWAETRHNPDVEAVDLYQPLT